MVEWQRKDRYGRTVGKVIVIGVDANVRMVEAGLAWHYKQYAKEQSPIDRASYAKAERSGPGLKGAGFGETSRQAAGSALGVPEKTAEFQVSSDVLPTPQVCNDREPVATGLYATRLGR